MRAGCATPIFFLCVPSFTAQTLVFTQENSSDFQRPHAWMASDGVRAVRELRSRESAAAAPTAAPVSVPRQWAPQELVAPRDCAASSTPVYMDDALSKRVANARHASLEASTLVNDLQEALAGSRGIVATMRANYQSLYEAAEMWRQRYLEAVEGDSMRDAAATVLKFEALIEQQRLRIEALQQALAAAEAAATAAGARERSALEKANGARQMLERLEEELAKEKALRLAQGQAAHEAAQQAAAELAQAVAAHEAASKIARTKISALEEEMSRLNDSLREALIKLAKNGKSQADEAAAAAAAEAEAAAMAAAAAAAMEALRKKLSVSEGELCAATAERMKLTELLRKAEEALMGVTAQAAEERGKRDAALAEEAARASRAEAALRDLREELRLSTEKLEALQKDYLRIQAQALPPPAPAAAPPPPAMTASEMELRSLRSERDSWRLVAEQAELMKDRSDRELKQTKLVLAQLKKDAERERLDKENGAAAVASVPSPRVLPTAPEQSRPASGSRLAGSQAGREARARTIVDAARSAVKGVSSRVASPRDVSG